MKIVTYIIILITFIVGISFSVLNAELVAFHYYVGVIYVPLSILLVFFLIAGAILGLISGLIISLRFYRKNVRLRQKVKQLESI